MTWPRSPVWSSGASGTLPADRCRPGVAEHARQGHDALASKATAPTSPAGGASAGRGNGQRCALGIRICRHPRGRRRLVDGTSFATAIANRQHHPGGARGIAPTETPPRRDYIRLAACVVLWFGLYNVALNTAERTIDAGTAVMLVNVSPILIAVLGSLLLHKGFPRRLLVGYAVLFVGTCSSD